VQELAKKNNLQIIAQHYDTMDADVSLHLLKYETWLKKVSKHPWVKISSQTGRDFFTFEQNKMMIDAAARYGVIHETHRGKFSFAAHVTRQYLQQLPELRITLDVSHWVNVSETYLDDQLDALDLAIERTDHIHARVGYPEGPQVPDPRAPEWQEALHKHLQWWDAVVHRKRKSGELLTITPEFGPFPYMVHLPDSGEPIADQSEVNKWMMALLRNRYK
jgi:hypothetical protein